MKSKNILSCWHKLEHFSPAELPKGNNVKQMSNTSPCLSWQISEKKNKAYVYTIYLGVFNSDYVREFVEDFFGSKSLNPNKFPSSVYYASLKLDEAGVYIKDSLGISDMPWALGQLDAGDIQNDSWDSKFSLLKAELLEVLTENFNELEDNYLSYLSLPQTFENFKKIQELIINSIGWKKRPDQISIFYKTDEEFRDKPSKPESSITENTSDIISSFYVRDLEMVLKSLEKDEKDIDSAFMKYIKASLNEKMEHRDISTSTDIIKESLVPSNFPYGCWPSKYRASLMQQFAVNKIYKELSGANQRGIYSVNGPPGTGKTTLLRDITASILVDRAIKMVEIDNPARAFKKIGEARISETFTPFIYEPDASICNGGIVVASSNNGAVENISKELPLKKEIGDFTDSAEYFRSVSENCLDREYWGLIAVVFGNKANQRKAIDAIWNGVISWDKPPKNALKKYFDDNKKTQQDWNTTISMFKNKLAEVDAEREKIEKIYVESGIVEDYRTKLNGLAHEIETDRGTWSELVRSEEEVLLKIDSKKQEKKEILLEIRTISASKPSFFTYWFDGQARRQYRKALFDSRQIYNDINDSLKLLNSQIKATRNKIDKISSLLNGKQEKHSLYSERINSFEKSLMGVSLDLGNTAYWDNIDTLETQKTIPWYSDRLKELQSELFIEAMKVNEMFLLLANTQSSRIKTTLIAFFAYLKRDLVCKDEAEIRAMWNVFWLVIPVVSTTFASISKMFKYMGKESIPWLFIDEAGQAVPQAAVGAIWRSKRVVVVGDPFQIEPVVKMSDVIVDNISKYFDLGKDNIHSSLSVQSMSDKANKYGQTIRDTWVGSPLRVHRRCIDPMFHIANDIAYEGIMYNATIPKDINSTLKTEFIQVKGNVSGKHYVPEQGAKIQEIIIAEMRHLGQLPDIFVISPFSEVSLMLKKALLEPMQSALSPYVDDASSEVKDWLNKNIGTVHTFQGKQAESVILCLGLDDKTAGAANWASSKPNILNVALTRAKFRFVAVGDGDLWFGRRYFGELRGL